MRLFILLFLSVPLALMATDYTYNTTYPYGLWGMAGNWSPNGVPGSTCGDTVTIPDGMVVTLNQSICIGTSGANGTVAINLNNTGQLKIVGGSIQVRGDVVGGINNGTWAVQMSNGSSWQWDASAAVSPSTTHYQYRSSSGTNFYRAFNSTGTADQRNSVSSNPGGGVGQFAGGAAHGGQFTSSYTDFVRIGDVANFGWQVAYNGDNSHAIRWDATYSTFTNCGAIVGDGSLGPETGGFFRHSHNVHSQSAATSIFSNWVNIIDPTGSTLEIRGNVFDVMMSANAFYPTGFTIWSNYFGDSTVTGPGGWNAFQGNLLRWSKNNSLAVEVCGDIQDSYIFIDGDWGNNKPLAQNTTCGSNLRGIIYGQAGTGHTPPGQNDSGELWFNNPASTPGTVNGIYNSIILPNMGGFGSLELGALTSAFTGMQAVAEHVTYFGGFVQGLPGGTDQFAAIDTEEDNPCCAGQLQSFRSNILWNPELQVDSQGNPHDYRSSFYKVKDLWPTAPTPDVCAPANCDYNAGWNHTLTYPAAEFTNQGKGYTGKFSSPPGVHDVDVNPKFVDYQRSLELFDSRYLGNNPATWDAGASYNAGDFVQWRRQDIYWALPVNYRYVNGGACGGTNPEPGYGTNWRSCWEWASLYRLRQAIAAGTTYDDQFIGASGDDAIMTVIKWIRAGYSPTNTMLAGAAHDGVDIGAVPVTFAVTYPTTDSGGLTVRGGTIR